jgi:hypothetical protein
MSKDHSIVIKTKAAVSTDAVVGPFSQTVKDLIKEGVEQFELAPDEYVDVSRLPPSVNTLRDLYAHLKSIQTQLSSRDNKVKNEDWDVAKRGDLRLYKLYVCGLHAMHGYINSATATPAKFGDYVSAVIAHGRTNKPKGLAGRGSTLWDKTFAETQPRTRAVISSILFFMQEAGVPPASATGSDSGGTQPKTPTKGKPKDDTKTGPGEEGKEGGDDKKTEGGGETSTTQTDLGVATKPGSNK